MEVFEAAGKGMGLKLLEPVSKGQFIAEYVGEVSGCLIYDDICAASCLGACEKRHLVYPGLKSTRAAERVWYHNMCLCCGTHIVVKVLKQLLYYCCVAAGVPMPSKDVLCTSSTRPRCGQETDMTYLSTCLRCIVAL